MEESDMFYYVFRKNVNDGTIRNCEAYESLDEAKFAAQEEEYYRSHSNSQPERESWKVVLAESETQWSDLTTDAYDYNEIDYNE